MNTIKAHIKADITRSSLRLNPSSIDRGHPIVLAAKKNSVPLFGSPTLSDQALLTMPSVKMGPGRSERSHTPDEFIMLAEIEEGIKQYIALLNELLL
jgi:acetylornithine deacetylase